MASFLPSPLLSSLLSWLFSPPFFPPFSSDAWFGSVRRLSGGSAVWCSHESGGFSGGLLVEPPLPPQHMECRTLPFTLSSLLLSDSAAPLTGGCAAPVWVGLGKIWGCEWGAKGWLAWRLGVYVCVWLCIYVQQREWWKGETERLGECVKRQRRWCETAYLQTNVSKEQLQCQFCSPNLFFLPSFSRFQESDVHTKVSLNKVRDRITEFVHENSACYQVEQRAN